MLKSRFWLLLAPFFILTIAAAPADEEAELRRAAQSLNSVLGDTAQEAKTEEIAKDPARAKRLLAVARKMNEEKSSPLAYSANFILGCVALELRDAESGEALFAKAAKQAEALKSDQKATMAYLYWIDLQIAAKKYDDAEQTTKKLLERELEDENGRWAAIGQAFGLRKLIQIMVYRGKAEDALKKLANEKPMGFNLVTKAWVLTYMGKYADAATVYEDLLKMIGDRESEAASREMYSRSLGSLYGDMGQIDKANAVLEPLLKKNPDDEGLKNDLGYVWAEHGVRLDEAEKMIRQAVEAKPTNGNYVDSLAWVLYKQKKYDEAKKLILKAIAMPKTQNTEIYEHLGDIHMALNEKTEAKTAWTKAVELATGSARDQKRKTELEKKIKEAGE